MKLAHERREGGTCQADRRAKPSLILGTGGEVVSVPHYTDEKTVSQREIAHGPRQRFIPLETQESNTGGLYEPYMPAPTQPGSRNIVVPSLSAVTPEAAESSRGRFGRDGG